MNHPDGKPMTPEDILARVLRLRMCPLALIPRSALENEHDELTRMVLYLTQRNRELTDAATKNQTQRGEVVRAARLVPYAPEFDFGRYIICKDGCDYEYGIEDTTRVPRGRDDDDIFGGTLSECLDELRRRGVEVP